MADTQSRVSHLRLMSSSKSFEAGLHSAHVRVAAENGIYNPLSGSRGRNPPVEGGNRHAKVLCHISRRYATGQQFWAVTT